MSVTAEDGRPNRPCVWDPVVRGSTFTGSPWAASLALAVPGSRNLHEALGLTIAAVLAIPRGLGLRRHAPCAFADFVPGPRRFFGYLRDLYAGREALCVVQPGGGAMVVALMSLLALTAGSGGCFLPGSARTRWNLSRCRGQHHRGLVALHLGGVLSGRACATGKIS